MSFLCIPIFANKVTWIIENTFKTKYLKDNSLTQSFFIRFSSFRKSFFCDLYEYVPLCMV